MAKTHGHGNPDWTRDETILALALYFESGTILPSRTDSRVRELSELLRNLPYHAGASKKPSFRNPDGVAFKLQNLHNVATGKGLANVSEMDRKIWSEFGKRPQETKALANLIRLGVSEAIAGMDDRDTDDTEFYEGRILTALHKRKERNPRLRKKLLTVRKHQGRLVCELCSCPPRLNQVPFADAIFEAHHTLPLSVGAERVTKIADLCLLCANCHRLIHRAISVQKEWLTVDQCRSLLMNPSRSSALPLAT
jgi:5-methylcytosine-specific restriction protein A